MLQWQTSLAYPERDVAIMVGNNSVAAEFRDHRYTVVCFLSNVIDVQPEHFYRVDFEKDADHVRCYVYYICRDADGKELCKGYLCNGERFSTPPNSAHLALEILMTGKGKGSAQVSELTLCDEGPYQPRKVKICTVAYELFNKELVPLTFEENVALAFRQIDAVATQKPDVIVLTENVFQTGEKVGPSGKTTPVRLNDESVSALRAKAKEYNCYIVTSLLTLDDDDILHNTCILIDRNGEIQGTSHKTHLTIGEKERGLELGTELPVFDTDFGRIGMLVCWEHFFPEAVRALALQGAELILVPTHGFRLDRAATRALENGVYFVTSHVRGSDSVILDQHGRVIADGVQDGYACAQIDMNKKVHVPYLSCSSWADPNNIYMNERRPEIYRPLIQSSRISIDDASGSQ